MFTKVCALTSEAGSSALFLFSSTSPLSLYIYTYVYIYFHLYLFHPLSEVLSKERAAVRNAFTE